jgi:hypothetical protein
LAQPPGRHLDADVMVGEADDADLGNLGVGQYPVLEVLGVGLEVDRVLRPGHRQRDHRLRAAELGDHRRLDLVREVVDGVHLGLHVVEEAHHFRALAHHRGGGAHALAGLATQLIKIGDAFDGVFQTATDRVFHVLGGGAAIDQLDLDLIVLNLRKGLALQARQGGEPEDHARTCPWTAAVAGRG